jgi:hypothetical protein
LRGFCVRRLLLIQTNYRQRPRGISQAVFGRVTIYPNSARLPHFAGK